MSKTLQKQIVSWNVNGIRACFNKGAFFDYLHNYSPDLLFIQETKLHVEQVPPELDNPLGYYSIWFSGERKGYSGVAAFTKEKPLHIFNQIGIEAIDREGRVIGLEFNDYIAFGVYFPNGQSGEERLDYKLYFYREFFDYIERLKETTSKAIIITGDYNTAHNEIDLARPKENELTSGFMRIERDWLDKVIDEYKFTDTFRYYNKNKDEYSWWSYRAGARERNVGWRIDYCFITEPHIHAVKEVFIQQGVTGSDHCPVGIILEL
jgi:exodeoxyribonuclease-3